MKEGYFKGFAALLLILLVLVVFLAGAGIYWYSKQASKVYSVAPSPIKTYMTPQASTSSLSVPIASANQVKSWQTYTDAKLNFRFDYPPQLSVSGDSEQAYSQRNGGDARQNFTGYVQYSPGKFLAAVSVLGTDASFDTSPFTIWIFDNPDNLAALSWFERYWYYPFMWGQFDPPEKQPLSPSHEASVSGQPVLYGVVSYQLGSPKYYYIPTLDNHMMLVRVLNSQNSIGDQILTTLKIGG